MNHSAEILLGDYRLSDSEGQYLSHEWDKVGESLYLCLTATCIYEWPPAAAAAVSGVIQPQLCPSNKLRSERERG